MKHLLACIFIFAGTMLAHAQVKIRFQSASSSGTAGQQASNGTLKGFSAAGSMVASNSAFSNKAGFFAGVGDLTPGTQATNVLFSSPSDTELTISWTNGSGNKRLVVGHAGGPVSSFPENGVVYTANTVFGLGTQIGSGDFVVYNNSSPSSVTVTGLTPLVVYHFRIFEYNGPTFTGLFKTAVAAGNPASRTTIAANPTTQASSLSVLSVANNAADISWTNGSGARRIVLGRAGGPVDGSPADGEPYTANSVFGAGDEVGTGNFVVYDGTGNSTTVTGLSQSTTYHFQVFEYNGNGVTINYLVSGGATVEQLTLPDAPAPTGASAISQNSFACNWNPVTGATGYLLDVSTDDFASFITGFNDLSTTATLVAVENLMPGSNYQYRVRAVNGAGVSGYSTKISVVTLSATPGLNHPDPITDSGFTISWTPVTGADSYRLDISTDGDFTAFVTGYDNKVVASTSTAVTGLMPGTVYYARVRAVNASGSSPDSNVVSQITVPQAPTGLTTLSITPVSMVAKWDKMTGASSYLLEVSKDNFVTLTGAYVGTTTQTSEGITSLAPGTIYRYRVKSINSAGQSAFSYSQPESTTSGSTLTMGTPVYSTSTPSNGSTKASVQVTGGTAFKVRFRSRKISSPESSFRSVVLEPVNNSYEATITSDMIGDDLGLEFYFIANDNSDSVKTQRLFTYRAFEETTPATIPFAAGFDGKRATYQMFSVPYVITNSGIDEVFDEMLGYDKLRWRIFHYQRGAYAENKEGLNNIEPGKSYWINMKEPTAINAGKGVAIQSNQGAPFPMVLEQGWNQIGNPFPFNISWAEVQAANPAIELDVLYEFQNGYSETGTLKPWKGAFLYADKAATVMVPVTAKCSGCRIAGSDITSSIDDDRWRIPFTVTFNDLTQTSRIGMHPGANFSKDKFDGITLPRFLDYLEMNTYHRGSAYPFFSTDIVPTADSATWEFSLSSNQKSGTATLTWNQASLASSTSGLFLLDVDDAMLIDMRETAKYSFEWKEGKKLRILYNRKGEIFPGRTLLGNSYPNPFDDSVTIPVMLAEDQNNIEILIYDLQGRRVRRLALGKLNAGLHRVTWNVDSNSGQVVETGMYLYQLWGDSGILAPVKRMIKR